MGKARGVGVDSSRVGRVPRVVLKQRINDGVQRVLSFHPRR